MNEQIKNRMKDEEGKIGKEYEEEEKFNFEERKTQKRRNSKRDRKKETER
jgi:hypothetical protein